MKKSIYLTILIPLFALASSGGEDYDIIPRTINFVIFIAILLYFIATPLKNFYKNRILKISSKLDEIQKRLLESKNKKLNAVKKLEEVKTGASSALITAKKEAEILSAKIKTQAKEELELLDKHFEEHKNYELRKMEKEVVSELIIEIFNDSTIELKQNEIVDIMVKKVS